jgi:hypothetical protein
MKTPFTQQNKGGRGRGTAGFTMVEVAICLAIVAFAMVAIMGVLPAGMQVQRENREDTIINYDGSYFVEAIRSGAVGLMDLTNYVEWIMVSNRNSRQVYSNFLAYQAIGLLTTPRYFYNQSRDEWITNTVLAKVRAIGGAASDKLPVNAEYVPQIATAANAIRDLSFSYLLTSEVIPYLTGPGELTTTNGLSAAELAAVSNRVQFARQMRANAYDLRLTLRWPVRPRDVPGNNSQTFRALLSGAITSTNQVVDGRDADLFYFHPSTFIQVPK